MLVLQRKKGQSLKIGDDITISITDIGTDSVRIAIEAPRNIPILRNELEELIQTNQEALVKGKDIKILTKKMMEWQ